MKDVIVIKENDPSNIMRMIYVSVSENMSLIENKPTSLWIIGSVCKCHLMTLLDGKDLHLQMAS